MRKFFIITLFAGLFFLIEFMLGNQGPSWMKPNLLILLIVFTHLAWGIRYSLYAALLAGLLKDSFSTAVFGINIFSFVICAYFIVFLKKYIYRKGSIIRQAGLVSSVLILNNIFHVLLQLMFEPVRFLYVLGYVMFPEMIFTLSLMRPAFNLLKQCVLRLSA